MSTIISKYWKQFVVCHKGTVNKLVHLVGFSLIGLGIIDKSLLLVIIGGITQELGHFYEYYKTKNPKESPLYCLKPQSIFAFPLFILIVLYVLIPR